jgi:multiple sugar transport system permease protein
VSVTDWVERLTETQFAYLLLTPVFLLLGAIAFWPLASTFEMSLRADSLVGAANIGEFVGLDNYVDLLTGARDAVIGVPFFDLSRPFSSALLVTIIFAAVSVLLETILGFAAALALDKEFTGRRWVRVALILPWSVPIVIQGMVFFLMFAPGVGFATPPLADLGVIDSTPLNDSLDSLMIVIVADVWKTTAFMMLLILAGLQSIDRDLYNVGKVAGATRWQQFKLITFPLVLPAILVAMLFRTINAMRVFGLIESVSGCGTVPSLSCMVVSTFGSRRYGTSAAIAFITAAIIGAVVLVYIVRFARSRQGVI